MPTLVLSAALIVLGQTEPAPEERGESPELASGERGPSGSPQSTDTAGMLRELGRMLLVLTIIVGGMYLFARLLGPRLNRAFSGRSKHVRVIERVPLDSKHVVFLLETEETRLLIGGSEKGLALLWSSADKPQRSFRSVLEQSANDAS